MLDVVTAPCRIGATIRVAPVQPPSRLHHASSHYLLAPVLMMMAAPPLCLRPNWAEASRGSR
jgi:hypothetical protein